MKTLTIEDFVQLIKNEFYCFMKKKFISKQNEKSVFRKAKRL